MTKTDTKRLVWVDYMKAFSIMAVVLFHTQIAPEIRTAVYLVCLPAFFFSAGMFTNTRLSPKEFFLRKTLRLLIPYLIWGLLTWVFWFFLLPRFSPTYSSTVTWWQPLVGMLHGRGSEIDHNVPLWFLCCMMSLEWIYYLICRLKRPSVRWVAIISIAVMGCVLAHFGQNWVWGISAACIILPLYAVGAEYQTFFKENIRSLKAYIRIPVFLISLAGLWVGYTYNGDIALCDSVIGNPGLYYLTVFSAVGLWIPIALLLEKSQLPLRVLRYMGQNTLLILCAHMSTFSIIKGIATLCHIPFPFWATTAGSIVLCLSTVLLLLPLAYLIHRYCPWMISPLPLSMKTESCDTKLSESKL